MRENCTYSSEGGVTFKPSSLPLSQRSRVIRGLRTARQRYGVRWQRGRGLTPLWMERAAVFKKPNHNRIF
jgi:hypothetical protein